MGRKQRVLSAVLLFVVIGGVSIGAETASASGGVDDVEFEFCADELHELADGETIQETAEVSIRFSEDATFENSVAYTHIKHDNEIITDIEIHTDDVGFHHQEKQTDIIFAPETDYTGDELTLSVEVEYTDPERTDTPIDIGSIVLGDGIDDPSIEGESIGAVSVSAGKPADVIFIDAPYRESAKTHGITKYSGIVDAYGNLVPHQSGHWKVFTEDGEEVALRATQEDGRAILQFGEGMDFTPRVGTFDVRYQGGGTAYSVANKTTMEVYPPAFDLSTSRAEVDGIIDTATPLTVTTDTGGADIDNLGVKFELESENGAVTISKGDFSETVCPEDPVTTHYATADAVRDFEIAAQDGGEHTVSVQTVPESGTEEKTFTIQANTGITEGTITAERDLIGVGSDETIPLTVTVDEKELTDTTSEQQQLTAIEIGGQRIYDIDVTRVNETTYEVLAPVDQLDGEQINLSDTSVSALFGETISGQVTTEDVLRLVHERVQLSGEGWHRLTVPYMIETRYYTGVTRDNSGDPIEVWWDETEQEYTKIDSTETDHLPHRGWYMHTESATELGFVFEKQLEPASDLVYRGWNLIGSSFDSSSQSTITVQSDIDINDQITLVEADKETELSPWETHWVHSEWTIGIRSIDWRTYNIDDRQQQQVNQTISPNSSTADVSYPGTPAYYTGTVTIDGEKPDETRTITATFGDQIQTTTVDETGQYELLLASGFNETVEFSLANESASTTDELSGGLQTHDLSINTTTDESEQTDKQNITAQVTMPDAVVVGDTVEFSGNESAGEIHEYHWSIGDKAKQGKTVTTTMDTVGTKSIELMIIDKDGNSDVHTGELTVLSDESIDESGGWIDLLPFDISLTMIFGTGLALVAIGVLAGLRSMN